jgi:hypothetical protein
VKACEEKENFTQRASNELWFKIGIVVAFRKERKITATPPPFPCARGLWINE